MVVTRRRYATKGMFPARTWAMAVWYRQHTLLARLAETL